MDDITQADMVVGDLDSACVAQGDMAENDVPVGDMPVGDEAVGDEPEDNVAEVEFVEGSFKDVNRGFEGDSFDESDDAFSYQSDDDSSDDSEDDLGWTEEVAEESGDIKSSGSFVVDSSDDEQHIERNMTEEEAINRGRQ